MSTQGTKACAADPKTVVAAEEAPERERSRIGEGLGVFRALLLTVLFYAAFGFLAWYGWYAFKHWRGH